MNINSNSHKRECSFEPPTTQSLALAKLPPELISSIFKEASLKTVLTLIKTCKELEQGEFYVTLFYESKSKISFELFRDTLKFQKELKSSIWACCPTISHWGALHDSVIPKRLPNLKHLEVDQDASDAEILQIVLSTTQLVSLDLSKNSNVSNESLIKISKHCQKLTYLNLDDNTQISADTICTVTKNCSGLNYLNLSHCDASVTGALIRDISINCPQLEKLYIDHLNELAAEDILPALANHCANLKELSIGFTAPVDPSEVIKVMSKTSLTVLNLNNNMLIASDDITTLASHGQKLEELSLAASQDINLNAFVALASNCKKLKSLDLTCAHIDAEGVVEFAKNCPTLEYFKADDCIGLTLETVVALVQWCSNLKEIDVSNNSFPGSLLATLKAIKPNLKILI